MIRQITHMEHPEEYWLEETDTFKFFSQEEVDGEPFQVYLDDYGQCFHLAWFDPITNELQQWSCGSYNTYLWDMEDIAAHIKKQKEGVK